MTRLVDLHTHSNYSDGTLSPAKVVGLAHRRGIEILVLTDHDTVSGVSEAREEARRLGQRFAEGIEINTLDEDNTHILGYGIDASSGPLIRRLEEFRERRQGRVRRIVDRLRGLGIELAFEDVLSLARETLGRPHVADALKRKNIVSSRSEAFKKYLSPGAPAYVDSVGPSVEESISAIREAGGWAVLAHPGMLTKGRDIGPWVDAGLEGIEAYYGSHSRPQVRRHLEIAKRYGLIPTGGSDFHGPRTERKKLSGVELPDDVFSRIEERL